MNKERKRSGQPETKDFLDPLLELIYPSVGLSILTFGPGAGEKTTGILLDSPSVPNTPNYGAKNIARSGNRRQLLSIYPILSFGGAEA